MSGPSISAGVSPMQIGVSRTEPTSSVPMRAVNDSVSEWPRPSRMRNALRATHSRLRVRITGPFCALALGPHVLGLTPFI